MNQNLGGVVWTNHALQKLKERRIKQGDAWITWKNPQQNRYAKSKSAWVSTRKCGSQIIEVVSKQNEKKEWIIISVWSKPILDSCEKSSSLISLLLKRFCAKMK